MVLHWKHYFPNCPFSLERLQWTQGNVSNILSLVVSQVMKKELGMLVWRLVENIIPTVEKFPEHWTLSLGCWISVWGGVNLPESPQIQTGSPAHHRWKKHLSHKLLPKCLPCLSRKGQWAWSWELSHPDKQHHAGAFPFQRKTRQGREGGHS